MASGCCFFIPPYILEDLAASDNAELSSAAQQALATTQHVHHHRRHGHGDRATHGSPNPQLPQPANEFVPDYILEGIVDAKGVDEGAKQQAADTIAANRQLRDQRIGASASDTFVAPPTVSQTVQSIYSMAEFPIKLSDTQKDARGKPLDLTYRSLPGNPLRVQGQPMVKGNVSADRCYENTGHVLEFFKTVFQYTSVDGKNMPLVSSVGALYFEGMNAAWYGTYMENGKPRAFNQMVYGVTRWPGIFDDFTTCVDVIGHEVTHGITSFTSGLIYQDESGALNEHLSDAFGVMARQWTQKKSAEADNWLVGEDCFLPSKPGTAVRNMMSPGTAFKELDDWLGKSDPQPADVAGMKAFKGKYPDSVERDYGGVHYFSGIPNRAFVICALKFGGNSWDKAGKIWWKVATEHRIPPRCTFLQFADATVAATQEMYGPSDAKTVRDAWIEVGVVHTV